MRKAFVMMFAIVSLSPALFAKGHHGWEHVEKLKSGTPVLISLWSGRLVSGGVEAVGPDALRIDTADPEVGVGSLVEYSRGNIRRIVRVRRSRLPDPARWMAMGALIWGGVGFTSGAIYDVAHHENYHWLAGGLGGTALGFFGSCAVLAGAGAVDLIRHHSSLVYEDDGTVKALAN